MKTLYLDIASGISGDMFLGALLDLGVDFHALEEALEKLPVGGYHLHAGKKQKSGIAGTRFQVHLESGEDHHHHHGDDQGAHHGHEEESDGHGREAHGHPHPHAHHAPASAHRHEDGTDHDQEHDHDQDSGQREGGTGGEHEHSHHAHEHPHQPHRTFAQIREIIARSPYSEWVKTRATAVFERIARAEGKVHGKPAEEVHFHEVGAIDSIVDIVGACLALEMLGKPEVLASGVVEGTGWVDCAHGRLPVPAPATLEILGARGVPVTQCEEPQELVTPTGAALLAEFAGGFGPMQGLVAEKIAYGVGSRDNRTRPNVLRVILGETSAAGRPTTPHDWETDTISVLETNLDDVTPEILGHFVSKALREGALDVYHTPIQMKKNRPAVLLTVLCAASRADDFTALMLRETSAFGVRRQIMERRKLRREFKTVRTEYGPITVKVGTLDGKTLQVAPEFESCREVAEKAGVALREVYLAASANAANRS